MAQESIPDAQRGARDVLHLSVCCFGEFRERRVELGGRFCGPQLEGVRPAGLGKAGVNFRPQGKERGGYRRDGLHGGT